MKKVQAFRCEHCGKMYLTERNCQRHEDGLCLKNPNIRPLCYSCQHYYCADESEKEIVEVYYDGYFGQEVYEISMSQNRCKHPGRDCKLFNNMRLRDDTVEAIEESGFEEMPRPKDGGCEYYKPWPNHHLLPKQASDENS